MASVHESKHLELARQATVPALAQAQAAIAQAHATSRLADAAERIADVLGEPMNGVTMFDAMVKAVDELRNIDRRLTPIERSWH